MNTVRKPLRTIRNVPDFKNSEGSWVNSQITTHDKFYESRLTQAGSLWSSFRRRIKVHPHYLGVTCAFADFQEFAEWCHTKIGYGQIDQAGLPYELDKDILCPGARVYGPETCCFVPRYVNSCLLSSQASRGSTPLGVSFHIRRASYQAYCQIEGRMKYLGLYSDPKEAHRAWQSARLQSLRNTIDRYIDEPFCDPQVVEALKYREAKLSQEYLSFSETIEV